MSAVTSRCHGAQREAETRVKHTSLTLLQKLHVVAQVARAGLTWLRHDTRYPSPVPENQKFRCAYDAVGLIRDGDAVAVSGLGGQQRASILYWAIRERFEQRGHPARLTVMNVGGHGGRGLAPGTLDELARDGLCTRFVTSHFETFHGMLALAEAGRCELQCLPLGVMTRLFAALGRGRDSLTTPVGLGTFLDPKFGRGTPVTSTRRQLVERHGARLRFRLPKLDVAILNAPSADRHGNVYFAGAAALCESREIVRAAKRNGGRVLVNVGTIVEPRPAGRRGVFLPARSVDALVYHPDTEQAPGVRHREPWPCFWPRSKEPIEEGLARVRFVNDLVPLLRRRSPADAALVRLAAATLVAATSRRAHVSIGTGMPEDVPATIYEAGALDRFEFAVESGVVGGLPAAGVFFGAALRPREIISSAELFDRCERRLDATCLGALEIGADGDVNVSKRGEGLRSYVGPGGFMDFATAARVVVFVSSWMHGGRIALDDGRLRIEHAGAPKVVSKVTEVTFDASRARRRGQRILYATHAGVLELGAAGLELRACMPGIDPQRDVVDFTDGRVSIPSDRRVRRVPRAVVIGSRGYLDSLLSTIRLSS